MNMGNVNIEDTIKTVILFPQQFAYSWVLSKIWNEPHAKQHSVGWLLESAVSPTTRSVGSKDKGHGLGVTLTFYLCTVYNKQRTTGKSNSSGLDNFCLYLPSAAFTGMHHYKWPIKKYFKVWVKKILLSLLTLIVFHRSHLVIVFR